MFGTAEQLSDVRHLHLWPVRLAWAEMIRGFWVQMIHLYSIIDHDDQMIDESFEWSMGWRRVTNDHE